MHVTEVRRQNPGVRNQSLKGTRSSTAVLMKSANQIQIQFMINREPRTVQCDPSLRLLDVLREQLRLTGTKEGCGKGECGACTVIMDGRTVDSCLVMAYQADGSEIWTIEGLPLLWKERCRGNGQPESRTSEKEHDELHPLQRAFVECGSSQCGICIPGMIMSAADLLAHYPKPSNEQVRNGLAGNLCRCTGYVKIFDAVRRASAKMSKGSPNLRRATLSRPPKTIARNDYIATTLRGALTILTKNRREHWPQLAGGTDALVRAKDGIGSPAEMFDIFKIEKLRGIHERKSRPTFTSQNGNRTLGEIWIGAATTFTEVLESPLLRKYAPALIEACAVIGGPQIRNRGTVGGNFANASPAADSVPALMSMNAILEIVSLKKKREVPATKFFLGPGRTVLRPDELIVGLRIPKLKNVVGCYLRLGQRQAQAISKVDIAVTAVLGASTDEKSDHPHGRFKYLGICFGSVAPTIFRATHTEKILIKQPLSSETLELAKDAVRTEVHPIDDIRSSEEYRREMSAVLLERALKKIGVI